MRAFESFARLFKGGLRSEAVPLAARCSGRNPLFCSNEIMPRTLREAITVAGQSEFISAELPIALQNKYFEYQTRLCHDYEAATDVDAWERANGFLII